MDNNDNNTEEMLKWFGIMLLVYAGFFIFVGAIAGFLVSCGANLGDVLFGCVVLLIIVCSSRAFEDWKDRL